MASPESAPSTPPSNSSSGAPESSNSTSSTPPPASPPPSPPASSPPSQSPPPSSPPPSSPPPSSSPPPQSSPPPKDSPPPSATPSPPPSSKSPPPGSPPVESPPPPSSSESPPPPSTTTPPTNDTQPSPVFSPPPPGTISSPTPPPPSEKVTPSPPPSSKLSPPPPRSNSSSTSSGSGTSSSSSNSSTNGVIIAGIVIGGLLALGIFVVCILCARKKKKQPYYIDTGRPPKPGDPYYNSSTPTQWNSPQAVDHIVKLPPPPGVMGTPSPLGAGGGGGGGGGWGHSPAPLVPNTSSEFSSGYSGQHHPHMAPPSPNMGGMAGGLGFSKSQFTYEELATATSGFSQVNLLGQGGFGYVHKGVLPDGREVAVKSLKIGSGQGEREFQAEVEIISRVHHRHLVSLVGYCIAEGQRMLVYEYVSNKTLEFHLHGKGQPVMDWGTRLQIALGSAKGLAYLHEDCHPRIIHRDIKAANILLDDKFEAMVADFGLAKLSSDNYTHVSTRVMGTFGYLAPEYASSGKLTEKSDVFSFGVMLLELITGRKPVDPTSQFMEDSLVDWARSLLTKALEDGNYDELVDPRLEENYITHEMARMIACASASIRHSARRRPKMSQIVRALEGDSSLEDLNDGKAGKASSGSTGSNETQTYDTGMYNADMMKFRKMVMSTSQDFASSEYGETSEYGLNPSVSSSDEFGNSVQHRKKP